MIKIFTFVKNEEAIINDWLLYHSYLFGCKNLYVVDHSSTDKTGIILERWKKLGVNVFKSHERFKMKSIILSTLMKKNSQRDFIIPLDADEFLSLKIKEELSTDKEIIKEYFKTLKPGPFRYKLHQVDVIPSKDPKKDPLRELIDFKTKWYKDWKHYAKTFYYSDYFVSTDQGNHKGQVKGGGKVYLTDLVILHYDVRDYVHFVSKMTKGAKAYGHHRSPQLQGMAGKHYHRRYWAIKEGRGYQQMIKEFGKTGNFKTNVLSQKLKELRKT
jgi:hypothetical protein